MSLNTRIAVGIDVCKSHLDVYHGSSETHERFRNTCAGIAELAAWLQGQPLCDVVVIEASGGYESVCWQTLSAEGFPVARVNPKRPRDFAKALGIQAKTDRLDARVLALYGATLGIEPTPPKAAELQEVEQYLQRRHQLVDMRSAESNRRPSLPPYLQERVDLHLAQLEEEIRVLDAAIKELIQADPAARRKWDLLTPIKGIGDNTCAWMIAALPELGHYDRRQIAALVGVAPIAHESGKHEGRRYTHGGRRSVRTALYMATLVAVRYEPRMRDFYQGLVARGKPKKVALVATMRKLLTIVNAIIRTDQPYRGLQAT